MKKIQKAALREACIDYTADYNQLLSMTKRFPLFKALPRELNPMFMKISITLNNKPYDTRSGSVLAQSWIKTYQAQHNFILNQGAKQWNTLPADVKDTEYLNWFKHYTDYCTAPDNHCDYCVLCLSFFILLKHIYTG